MLCSTGTLEKSYNGDCDGCPKDVIIITQGPKYYTTSKPLVLLKTILVCCNNGTLMVSIIVHTGPTVHINGMMPS